MFGFINRVDKVFSCTMAFSHLGLKIGCGFEGIARGYVSIVIYQDFHSTKRAL